MLSLKNCFSDYSYEDDVKPADITFVSLDWDRLAKNCTVEVVLLFS